MWTRTFGNHYRTAGAYAAAWANLLYFGAISSARAEVIEVYSCTSENSIVSCELSSSGRYLVASSFVNLEPLPIDIHDLRTKRVSATLTTPGPQSHAFVAISDDGLAVAAHYGKTLVWRREDVGKPFTSVHCQETTLEKRVVFDAKGSRLVGIHLDGGLYVCHLPEATTIRLKTDGDVAQYRDACISGDGRFVAAILQSRDTVNQGFLDYFDANTGKRLLHELLLEPSTGGGVSISHDGSTIVIAARYGINATERAFPGPQPFYIFRTAEERIVTQIDVEDAEASSVVSSDGKRIVVHRNARPGNWVLRVYDVDSRRLAGELMYEEITGLACKPFFYPNIVFGESNDEIIFVCPDHVVRSWKLSKSADVKK